jgi:nitroreductase
MTEDLTAEQLLMTTRAVRKRLDFDRPVSRDVLRECVEFALQAPSGSNRWGMQFVIVVDPEQRMRVGDVYRAAYARYREAPGYIGSVDKGDADSNQQQQRTARSADHLAENIHRAPALVIACGRGSLSRGADTATAAGILGSVLPGMWSFMLAARLRGLGTAWTTMNMTAEAETAEVLGVPTDKITMACLSPVAYTIGTDFKPALRPSAEEVIHWDRW